MYKLIPSAISLLRFILAVPIFLCAMRGDWQTAGILSAIAFASDWLDGFLAIKLNAKSKFGAIIDVVSDFALCVGLIAGAFFTEIIGVEIVFLLAAIFLFTWLPVVALTYKGTRANKIALAINRTYYVLVAVSFMSLYFYKAFGPSVVWLAIPIVSLTIWGSISCAKHHRSEQEQQVERRR